MPFDPEPDRSAEAVQDRVDDAITDNEVVLFMKGTELMPQCGYSRKALGLVQRHREDVATVNVLDALEHYRDALEAHSGWETIPQVYVDGEFVGGSDVLEQLHERDELAAELGADA